MFTCAGATAGLDFMLELTRFEKGPELASLIASRFLVKEFRPAKDKQALKDPDRYGTHDMRLIRALQLMEDHIEDRLAISQIARQSQISQRSLERAFHNKFGMSPSQYYVTLRLDLASEYLTKTDLPILEIALRCGFNSQTQFGRAYKKRFDLTPSVARAGGLTKAPAVGE